jgi:hypothetical protein
MRFVLNLHDAVWRHVDRRGAVCVAICRCLACQGRTASAFGDTAPLDAEHLLSVDD